MMTLQIITPTGCVLQTQVTRVFLPGSASAFEVLKGHAPIVSTLDKGKVRYGVGEDLS